MIQDPKALDMMFQALADASRRQIVDRLSKGPASVGELAKPLDMSLPCVMQHLKMLEGSGLIRSSKTGRVRTCEIDPQALNTAMGWIADRKAAWEATLDRLGNFLIETADTPEETAN